MANVEGMSVYLLGVTFRSGGMLMSPILKFLSPIRVRPLKTYHKWKWEHCQFWWKTSSNDVIKKKHIKNATFIQKPMMFQSCDLKRLNKGERWWFVHCHFTCIVNYTYTLGNDDVTVSFIVIQNYSYYVIPWQTDPNVNKRPLYVVKNLRGPTEWHG